MSVLHTFIQITLFLHFTYTSYKHAYFVNLPCKHRVYIVASIVLWLVHIILGGDISDRCQGLMHDMAVGSVCPHEGQKVVKVRKF